jgi:hypothetical protein
MPLVEKLHETFRSDLDSSLDSITRIALSHFQILWTIGMSRSEWKIEDPAEWSRNRTFELVREFLLPSTPAGLTLLAFWFRIVSNDRQMEDTITMFIEPWCAPVWCRKVSAPWWERRGCSARLKPDQTIGLIQNEQIMWEERIGRQLQEAADLAGMKWDLRHAEWLTGEPTAVTGLKKMKLKPLRDTPWRLNRQKGNQD